MAGGLDNISSFYTQRKGIGGLASGLDTDAIVKGMTSATTTRITKLLQDKTKASWKTTAYQTLAGKLQTFQDKFLSMTSKTSLYSDSFFSSSNMKVNGDFGKYISVTGSSSVGSNLTITGIKNTATTSTMVGKENLSPNEIKTGVIDFSADGKILSNVSGQTMNVSYDGKVYEVKLAEFDIPEGAPADEKARIIASQFNTALSKVEIGEDANGVKQTLGDKFQMDTAGGTFNLTAQDPDAKDLKIEGASGKLLTALGMETGKSVTATEALKGEVYKEDNFITKLNFKDSVIGKEVSFALNGVTKKIVFDESMDYSSADGFAKSMNEKLDIVFGKDRVQFEAKADGSFGIAAYRNGAVDTTSKLEFSLANGNNENLIGENGVFGMPAYSSSKISITEKLGTMTNSPFTLVDGKGSIEINGVKVDYTADDTIANIMNRINRSDAGVTMTFMETSDAFSIKANSEGIAGTIQIKDLTGNFAEKTMGNAVVDPGKDAEIEISYDGGKTTQTLQRSGNSFKIDGMTITLEAGAENAGVSATNPISFTATPKTDEIVDAVKEMVDAYNDLTSYVNTELSSRPNKGYPPLTDEQRADMSEKQIEQWEEKAKVGVLFSDPILRELSTELRFAFSFDVEGAASLKDMGISTSSSYSENGKLILDEDKLRAAIENDPTGVQKAFTQTSEATKLTSTTKDSGLMERFKTIYDKYAKKSGSFESMGLLIKTAGIKDSATTRENSMSKQIEAIDEQLVRLKATLKSQETRYYNQFTALEKYISQMEAQSSWLTQNMG